MKEKTKRVFLKPCPLCGSAPELHSFRCDPWGDGAGYATAYFYQCTGCRYIKIPEMLSTSYSDNERVQEELRKAWNESVDEIKEMIMSNYNVQKI